MIWVSTALIALVLSAIGYAIKEKRPSRNLLPIRTARKMVKASPSSVSVALLNSDSKGKEVLQHGVKFIYDEQSAAG